MPYIVLFKDNPNAPADIRQKHMPDHLAFLEGNSTQIMAAGPLHDTAGAGAGGLWVVDVDTPEAVEALIHADPFWPTGLRETHQILKWTQVFADGARKINVS